jgi:carbamoyltransferase
VTNILGISCYYHDAAAALVQNGDVVAGAEEERFTRRKHDSGFPRNAIRFCLARIGVAARDLDRVVFYDKPLKKLERALVTARGYGDRADRMAEWHLSNFVHRESRIAEDVAETLGVAIPVEYCEHHLSHAASAFYASPFERAAILTVDGVGEWATTGIYAGGPAGIEQLKEIRYPHSLGLFYATLTAYLGFEVNEGEYKVMGLASYGKPTYDDRVGELLQLHEDGSFRNNLDFYAYMYDREAMYTSRLVDLLGPPRAPNEPVTERHRNIAASMQKLCEEALVRLARAARRETGIDRLCLAGGVAHNVVANSRVLNESGFAEIFVQPASGDSGGAIGAALHAHHRVSPAQRRPVADYDTCIGPSFTDTEIEEALHRFGAAHERLEPEELPRRAARLLADNFVVGWFQGRMEFGPRALGCRSILANPCDGRMKDILNARIKHREDFRPFAPAVLEERSGDYFEHPGKSPYMLFCPPVRREKRELIPAVTHVDGTARMQTVSKTLNPRFHALIAEFGRLTGVPVLVNTSFNIRGEPIVCSPTDALKCFYGTDIDFLAIGDFVVGKSF